MSVFVDNGIDASLRPVKYPFLQAAAQILVAKCVKQGKWARMDEVNVCPAASFSVRIQTLLV